MKYTIEDLREGRCSVKNDGTKEELIQVLKKAFPKDNYNLYEDEESYLEKPYFEKSALYCGNWINTNCNDYPTQSVKDFLIDTEEWKPKEGDRVLVRRDHVDKWEERIYLCTIPRVEFSIVTVAVCSMNEYKETSDYITVNHWKYMKQLPKVEEMTLEEVCKELGRDIKIVK
jgi:hypothetical protein